MRGAGALSVCVRLCMLISCFIEEAVFACADRSDFLCEKKGLEKKRECVDSHESVWETSSFLGSCPALPAKSSPLVKCKRNM